MKFIDIHSLTSYPAALLNRDDAGFAKRMPFGGATRTRVSSQCLKRRWRTHDGQDSLQNISVEDSTRSRTIFTRMVERLVEGGEDVERATAIVRRLRDRVVGINDKDTSSKKQPVKKKESKDPVTNTKQVIVLGTPEIRYIEDTAKKLLAEGKGIEAAKLKDVVDKHFSPSEAKKNLKAFAESAKTEAGLSAALFGRMVTGDVLARKDAAIHVAHAFTVHAQQTESDYFSALDELTQEAEEQGAGHINAAELTSGLFYGYVSVDVPSLLRNLSDDEVIAGEVIRHLVKLVATVSPGAKRGSTAPYAYSHWVRVEAGNAQPRTLANAFLEPVSTRPHIVKNAYAALEAFLDDEYKMYGAKEEVAHAAMLAEGTRFSDGMSLEDLSQWAKHKVVG